MRFIYSAVKTGIDRREPDTDTPPGRSTKTVIAAVLMTSVLLASPAYVWINDVTYSNQTIEFSNNDGFAKGDTVTLENSTVTYKNGAIFF